jgi:prepilin-type N-terminal cleavage/methylation domain-containing protein
MGCSHKQNQNGFTLVEIAIVMIIVGLLIGGTFGGMKLIENMQVNKTVQELKSIESAALTFRDTYSRLPGDMPNTAARLPNCTVAPCATGGNGDRRLEPSTLWNVALTATSERFTFWHHLQAADVLTMGVNNTADLNFGEGQPNAPVGGGYRISNHSGAFHIATSHLYSKTMVLVGIADSALVVSGVQFVSSCSQMSSIDRKIDDGLAYNGNATSWNCAPGPVTSDATYTLQSANAAMAYDLKGF